MTFVPPVGLHNCDREPIQIPGSVQSHGALLAFDGDRRLMMRSANAAAILRLGESPSLGAHLSRLDLGEAFETALGRVFDGVSPAELNPIKVDIHGRPFDVIVHLAEGYVVAEFEPTPPGERSLDTFAVVAHQALAALQRSREIGGLLQIAVTEVRRLTGFDRVMAYRFLPDGSGEVVAEEHAPGMEPYQGLRYPATDIPAQARRLYVLNPLRLIADVASRPSPLEPPTRPDSGRALDQSHGALRSVSPIHIEYLGNMGVGASMSISIVVDGHLWGLIACHHLAARPVPYTVRMACLLIAQSLELLVERAEGVERRAIAERATGVLDMLKTRLEAGEDLVHALTGEEPTPLDLIDAGGFAVVLDGRISRLGQTPPPAFIADLAAWLSTQDDTLVATPHLGRLHPPAADQVAVAAGLIAARFHHERMGYVLWFRPELRHVVRWGGNPDKAVSVGPNGLRLTPRGSFTEWRQSVSGIATDWHAGEIELAETLRRQLVAAALRRATEVERMRDLFIGMLGHDLRNPLAAISMAARLVSRAHEVATPMDAIGARLSSSSERMKRLVDQMLDFSRLQAGQGLGIRPRRTDLHALVDNLVDELRVAYPGCDIVVAHRGDGAMDLDPDRIEQVVSNLVGNARHHGAAGRPIRVDVTGEDARVLFEVHNEGPPIAPELLPHLFSPYKRQHGGSRHSSGLGLGLYITNEIVVAHRGTIEVRSDDGGTAFRVCLPREAGEASPCEG
ncbi:MAG: ATP-binding protein [bacterium]